MFRCCYNTSSSTTSVQPIQQVTKGKVIFLGTGYSGKSTVFKQFSTEEFLFDGIKYSLIEMLLTATTYVLESIPGNGEFLKDLARVLTSFEKMRFLTFDQICTLNTIYERPVFQESLNRLLIRTDHHGKGQQLIPQFLLNYPNWGSASWTPSQIDQMIYCIRTSGLIEMDFHYQSKDYQLYDTGGQRTERKKWKLVKTYDYEIIFYVVSLASYDEELFEDSSTNAMEESLQLFSEVSSEWKTKKFVLVFNKFDVFREKISKFKIPLKLDGKFGTCPNNFDIEDNYNFIKSEFLGRNGSINKLSVHRINAVYDVSTLYREFESEVDVANITKLLQV